jgi:hypothetical protein
MSPQPKNHLILWGLDVNQRAVSSRVAHKILVAIYHMLSHQIGYNELGDFYLYNLNKHLLTRNLVHRLERLGYAVTQEQKAA